MPTMTAAKPVTPVKATAQTSGKPGKVQKVSARASHKGHGVMHARHIEKSKPAKSAG
jgi:hypothetical protein